MSQAAHTFWTNRFHHSPAKAKSIVRREAKVRRTVDGVAIAVILAATAVCVSIYSRGRAELNGAVAKRQAASVRLDQLKGETDRLQSEVQLLKTSPKAMESLVRQNMNVSRSGEVVMTVDQSRGGTTSKILAQAAPPVSTPMAEAAETTTVP